MNEEIRKQRAARLDRLMTEAMNEPLDMSEHPLPWSWGIAYHDGWFIQFYDANGKPCLGDDLREPEDAAFLLKTINALGTTE